ncbi:hypothetical protein ACHAW5_004216 [Stephanodiscus triporus]|uniref:Uncharacterized protein n=1 Tax=Stephanodiscus triporus TaxID=2934178 RepID=A0ABD3NNQ7_9STRA
MSVALAARASANARPTNSVSLPWLIAEVDGMATRVIARVGRRRVKRGGMKDGSIMGTRGCTSPGRSSLDQHQYLVAKATFDDIDQHRSLVAAATTDEIEQSCEDLSVASTVDVDNTHPYLLRYADMYAHGGGDDSSVGTPTFVCVKPSPQSKEAHQFKEGQKVLYTGSSGPKEAIIMKILYDTEHRPYYEIKLVETDKEEATESDKLDQKTTQGAADENGDPLDKCVNFKTNSTPLFQYLYQGKWNDAEQRLANNPEEATIWVARYAKSNTGSYDGENVRWKLLPLHLMIAKASVREATSEALHTHYDDEDAIQEEQTLKIITDLLLAYPQATQCRDDQNMIPLQQCIRCNGSLSIIDRLLEADPSSVFIKDARGRNAFILAEKVYGKLIHEQPVGSEDTAKLVKYIGLMALLRGAAIRVASTTASEPMMKALRLHVEQDELLQNLRIENLTLRRENAELHRRDDMNIRLLQQLIEKLQIYEEERSVENYKEIFGTKDDLVARREEILHSISCDDSEEMVDGSEQTKEKNVGGGAYHKRRERYLLSTPTGNKGNNDTALGVSGEEPKSQEKVSAVQSKSTIPNSTEMEVQNIFRVIASSENLPALSWEEEDLLQVE